MYMCIYDIGVEEVAQYLFKAEKVSCCLWQILTLRLQWKSSSKSTNRVVDRGKTVYIKQLPDRFVEEYHTNILEVQYCPKVLGRFERLLQS